MQIHLYMSHIFKPNRAKLIPQIDAYFIYNLKSNQANAHLK